MAGGRKILGALVIAVMSATALTGCLSAQIPESSSTTRPTVSAEPIEPTETPEPSPVPSQSLTPTPTQKPNGTAPAGWASFEMCGHEFAVEWKWIDGFPYEEMEKSGLYPVCAELWLYSRGADESMLSTSMEGIPERAVVRLGEALVLSGYVLDYDSFDPNSTPTDGFYGAQVYYLNGDDGADATGVAIEVYGEDVHNDSFQVYVDYFSPETRAN